MIVGRCRRWPQPWYRSPAPALVAAAGAAAILVSVGCTAEDATPIDPADPPVVASSIPASSLDLTDVTHTLEPTAEMRAVAEGQCREDPELEEGYVRAVDPETEAVLAEVTVDCDDVRS